MTCAATPSRALWERREGNTLTHAAYEQLGKVAGALRKNADEVLRALPEEDRGRALDMLVQLVQVGRGSNDTRRTVARDQLLASAEDEKAAEDNNAAEEYANPDYEKKE